MELIFYHLCTLDDWFADDTEFFSASSLETEGFIHLSTPEELVNTYKMHFEPKDCLLCLEVNLTDDDPNLVYEMVESRGIEMPHYYGMIPKNRVYKLHRVHNAQDAERIASEFSISK